MRLQFICFVLNCVVDLAICGTSKTNTKASVDSFSDNIKKGFEEDMDYFRATIEGEDPVVEQLKDHALHDLLIENMPEITSKGNSAVARIHKYEERVMQKGVDSIQAIAGHVENKLNLSHADVTPIIKKITRKYVSESKKYFLDLDRENPDCDVDKEYVVLDMVKVVSLIRKNIQNTLLDDILSLAETTPQDEIDILTGTLETFHDNDKQQEMEFICANFRICRPNPAFSDYLFKLLDEVAKLNDEKLHYFLIKSSQMLLKKSFLETVLRDKVAEWFKFKMNNMVTANITQMRQVVEFLRSVITRRYVINYTNEKKKLVKAKSASIIIDIVDIAFGIDGNELYGPEMDRTTSVVKEWAFEMRNDIETILHKIIQYIVEAMNYNLTPRAKEEIMVLADIIFYNKTGNQQGTEYLMTQGSKFVKGLVHRSVPKKLW